MKVTPTILRMRARWRFTGVERPPFAEPPGPGQESVWDYPRPPRVEADTRRVQIHCGDLVVADSDSTLRVLETASPPVFYVPPEDVNLDVLVPSAGASLCEWKGRAVYWSLRTDRRLLPSVGWSYPDPFPGFEAITDYLSVYPAHLECTVDGERVRPQPGGFYGGWVTDEIVGPYKGEPGTGAW